MQNYTFTMSISFIIPWLGYIAVAVYSYGVVTEKIK